MLDTISTALITGASGGIGEAFVCDDVPTDLLRQVLADARA